jgi:hypothetical protein
MSLLDRLLGTEDPTISSHSFMAALDLLAQEAVTRVQLENKLQSDPNFNVTAGELAHLDEYLDNVDVAVTPSLNDRLAYRMLAHSALMLGWVGSLTKAEIKTILNVAGG